MLANYAYFSSHADTSGVILWSCVLVVTLVVAFMLVMRVKRQLRDETVDNNPSASAGFTLSDLRQMHRDGVMSNDEFEKAKAQIVAVARKTQANNVSAKPLAGPGTSQQ